MSEPNDTHDHEMTDDPDDTEVMTAYAEPQDDYDDYNEYGGVGDDDSLPGRPRRVLVNRYSAGLAAVLIGAACFYAGVRVEKSQVPSSSGTGAAGGLAALASRFGAAGSSATSRTGAAAGGTTGARGGGFAGGFAGGRGAGAAGGTSGTISTIDGDTLYITDPSGNTVKVKLSDTTTLTKTVTVSTKSLFPGDTVSVTGASGSGGTVSATAVTDSGSGSSTSGTSGSTGSTGSTGSASTSSGSSALNSLFGG